MADIFSKGPSFHHFDGRTDTRRQAGRASCLGVVRGAGRVQFPCAFFEVPPLSRTCGMYSRIERAHGKWLARALGPPTPLSNIAFVQSKVGAAIEKNM
jgi:hypothetical protein